VKRSRSTRARGPLGPRELAEAVVLADVALALTVVGQVVPLGGALLAAAVVPMAVVAARHRLRAVITGTIAASVVGFLVIGSAAFTSMGVCAALGALVGAADRRNWSHRRTTVIGLAVLWPSGAVLADVSLLVFSNLRKLTLDQVRNGWHGLFHLLRNLGLVRVARPGEHFVTWVVRDWWLSVPLTLFLLLWFAIWLALGLSTPALRRVRGAYGDPVPEPDTPGTDIDQSAPPAPLPLALRNVRYRYPNAPVDAIADVTLELHAAELVAIVGANGSGKSTLARLLSGRRAATGGELERPGGVGFGRVGGTAIVAQRPEAQVLGVRVRDDVVWGMPEPQRVDVDAFLDRVGLRALADRETSTLSGGELQRLAVAAALARQPRLLISDESTAMVDAAGRAQLVALFHELVHGDGMGVVHVTHRAAEAAVADRIVTLDAGRIVETPARLRRDDAVKASGRPSSRPGAPLLSLRHVGHVYSRKTPWSNRALTEVDLVIREGEALVVVGHNGSGKSTLAWILAGLFAPSEGAAELEGRPIVEQVGRVGLSFQHARLQLLRPTVLDEVRSAAGVDRDVAGAALTAVGLDPSRYGARRVDELSGGQMRRVVLAGVVAAEPRAIVLDEPFAGLDADGREELDTVLTELRNRRHLALVIVSHDRDLPAGLVDRVVELEAGRITRDDPLEDAVPEAQP
jgi:energy-coupling factor transport system ATP-binding protein